MKTDLLRKELEKYDLWQCKNPNQITGSDAEIRDRYLSQLKHEPTLTDKQQ